MDAKKESPKNVKVHPQPAVLINGCTEYENAKFMSKLHIVRMTIISPPTPGKDSIAYAVAIEQALS